MTDQDAHERSQNLVALYRQYRSALDSLAEDGKTMPYRWWNLPDPVHVLFMPYGQMLGEYATELANIINDITENVRRLRAWATVTQGLSDNDQLEVCDEFIDPLGTVALGQPYAIKSRFAFAVGHLCHQANRARDPVGWSDEFTKEKLYLHIIEEFCVAWEKYRSFKLKLEPLAGKSFKEATNDFRNSYNHGFSPRLLVGVTGLIKRQVRDGRVSYVFGGSQPLSIATVADLLAVERDHCYRAFERFRALIEEHIEAIAAFDSQLKR
ncbi:hypothetical protein [Sphingomonas pituitosa]|uniref:hypothetical protein n=1 Tax=Sphingomonas pituitosa TaxID=99597 RepID=UPI00082A5E96|nr:hypothetical protein [Sphingomonas pituitosa]